MDDLLASLSTTNRRGVEQFVERLIEMLDETHDDPAFEPYLAGANGVHDDREGGDPDREPEETNKNGDEGKYSHSEDDALSTQLYCIPSARSTAGRDFNTSHR